MYKFCKVLYYFAQSQSHQIAGFNVLSTSFESLLCSLFPVIAELLEPLSTVDILQLTEKSTITRAHCIPGDTHVEAICILGRDLRQNWPTKSFTTPLPACMFNSIIESFQ